MIVPKKWVAAGSTATLLAGGLFLGTPMASAAPGDAACLQASTQFEAALAAAGITVDFVDRFEAATDAVVIAEEKYESIAAALGLEALFDEADRTYQLVEDAEVAVAVAQQSVDDAVALATAENVDTDDEPENDERVIKAREALKAAEDLELAAIADSDAADAAVQAAFEDPALAAAELELDAAAQEVQGLLGQVGVGEAVADQLLGLFEAFLAACDASAIGADPVTPVVVPAPVATPVVPVTAAAPAAPAVVPGVAPVAPAPVATNQGLNVQTAAAAENTGGPALALIAALLAAGVAVPMATAARMRRLERAQR